MDRGGAAAERTVLEVRTRRRTPAVSAPAVVSDRMSRFQWSRHPVVDEQSACRRLGQPAGHPPGASNGRRWVRSPPKRSFGASRSRGGLGRLGTAVRVDEDAGRDKGQHDRRSVCASGRVMSRGRAIGGGAHPRDPPQVEREACASSLCTAAVPDERDTGELRPGLPSRATIAATATQPDARWRSLARVTGPRAMESYV